MARQRITKAMKVLSKENVAAILVIWGYNEEGAKSKVEKAYDLALKALPNDDAKGVAEYVAHF